MFLSFWFFIFFSGSALIFTGGPAKKKPKESVFRASPYTKSREKFFGSPYHAFGSARAVGHAPHDPPGLSSAASVRSSGCASAGSQEAGRAGRAGEGGESTAKKGEREREAGAESDSLPELFYHVFILNKTIYKGLSHFLGLGQV